MKIKKLPNILLYAYCDKVVCGELFKTLDLISRYSWFLLFFQAVSNHESLALAFLEHVIRVLNQAAVYKATDVDKDREPLAVPSALNPLPQSATLALGAVFR